MEGNALLKKVSLANCAGGVASELFERELEGVLANIQDKNTPANKKRVITLTFEFTPDLDRREVTTFIGAKAKLAPVSQMKHTLYVGTSDHKPSLYGSDPKQMELDLHSEEVASIRTRKPYKEDV